MTADQTATQETLSEGARDIARGISMTDSIDYEHVRKEIRGLATRSQVVYSSASDAVHDELRNIDGVNEDTVLAYERYFPTPKSGQ